MITPANCARLLLLLTATFVNTSFAQTTQASDTTSVAAIEDGREPRVLHYRTAPPELDHSSASAHSSSATRASAADAVEAGALSAFVLPARVESKRSWAIASGGYDTAARAVRARSSAETALTSYLALRVDFEHGPSTGANERVGLGGRFQLLNQKLHGFDAGFGLFFQPNDFRREGNVLVGLLLGRRFGRLGIFGNALFGSDPEGDDQEFDGRLAWLLRIQDHLEVGWDNRFRAALSSDAKRLGTTTTDWEVAALPTATLTLGSLAFLAEVGFSAMQRTGPIGTPGERRDVRTGTIAMAGAAAVF